MPGFGGGHSGGRGGFGGGPRGGGPRGGGFGGPGRGPGGFGGPRPGGFRPGWGAPPPPRRHFRGFWGPRRPRGYYYYGGPGCLGCLLPVIGAAALVTFLLILIF